MNTLVTWHAWSKSLRLASAEFPVTHSGREVRDHFCDAGHNKNFDLRVTCQRPVVGMLATLSVGSDSYPFTVSEVSPSGVQITLTARKARGPLTIENPEGETRIARRRANGDYCTKGRHGSFVYFGDAQLHLDPSF